jgi:hypothetical protein
VEVMRYIKVNILKIKRFKQSKNCNFNNTILF